MIDRVWILGEKAEMTRIETLLKSVGEIVETANVEQVISRLARLDALRIWERCPLISTREAGHIDFDHHQGSMASEPRAMVVTAERDGEHHRVVRLIPRGIL